MRKKIQDWIEQYGYMDWAVLYMRLFAGGMLLFHNIGKMQDYNEIINSYPAFLHINNAAVFVIVTVLEVVLATLLILGLWVRPAASVLVAGMLVLLFWSGFGELEFVWLGIYVFLIISGGGIYAFDEMMTPGKAEK